MYLLKIFMQYLFFLCNHDDILFSQYNILFFVTQYFIPESEKKNHFFYLGRQFFLCRTLHKYYKIVHNVAPLQKNNHSSYTFIGYFWVILSKNRLLSKRLLSRRISTEEKTIGERSDIIKKQTFTNERDYC